MIDFLFKCVRRVSFFSVVFLFSCSGKAEIIEYLGCEWVIPNGYNKLSDTEYLGSDDKFGRRIVFGSYDSSFYEELKSEEGVLYLNFKSVLDHGRVLSLHFIVYEKSGVGTSHVSVRYNNSNVSLSGLSLGDALAFSKLCVAPEAVMELYDKLDSWYSEYCGNIGTDKAFCGDR